MQHTLTTPLLRLSLLVVSLVAVMCMIPEVTKAAPNWCSGSTAPYECCYSDGSCINFTADNSGGYWYNDIQSRYTASVVAVDVIYGASGSIAGSTCTTSNGYNCLATCANGVTAYTSPFNPALAGAICNSSGSTATFTVGTWSSVTGATKYGVVVQPASPCPSGWVVSSGWCTYGIYSNAIYGTSIVFPGATPGTTYTSEVVAYGAYMWSQYTSPWTTTCPATTVNGSCGGANGAYYSSAPSSGLCNSGSQSAVTGTGPWNWTCNYTGAPAGVSPSCTAYKITTVNGVCGSAQGGTYGSAPSSGLCSAGSQTTPYQSGAYWDWSCNYTGSPAGNNASCWAYAGTPGACGTANGNSYASQPSGNPALCNPGNVGTITNAGTYWYWYCASTNGGSSSGQCYSNIIKAGTCGSASGVSSQTAPSSNLCSSTNGNSTVTTSGSNWSWSCYGINGGASPTCTAPITPTNGQCGSANGVSSYTAPYSNLCNAGNNTTVTETGVTSWNWSCQGLNGGTSPSCSAPVTVSNGVCGTATGQIYPLASPPPGAYSLCTSVGDNTTPSANGSQWSWTCNGTGTGSNTACTATEQGLSVTCSPSPLTPAANATVTWTANVANGVAPYTYNWSASSPTIAGTTNPVTTSYASGSATGQVTVTDNRGVQATAACTGTVTVVSPTFVVGSTTSMSGTTYPYCASSNSGNYGTAFIGNVVNTGATNNGTTFLNFFQYASSAYGGGTLKDLTNDGTDYYNYYGDATNGNRLTGIASGVANGKQVFVDQYNVNPSDSWGTTFDPTASTGIHSMRLCGDMSDRNNNASWQNFALNASETYPNTCGPWSNFTISNSCSTLPDLTAGVVLPLSVSTGANTFSAAVKNIGGGTTGATAFNVFFQVASSTSGGGTVQSVAYTRNSPTSLSSVAVNAYSTTTLSYTFNLGGTYSMRLCADEQNITGTGATITERNENNNCGPWTTINVTQANLTASNNAMSITAGAVTLSGMVINNGSAATQSGVSFSNYFQVASSTNGGGTIQDINSALNTPSSLSNFAVGSQTVTVPYKFNTGGRFSYRLCADGTSSAGGGTISESNSADNCGAWTDVVVTAPVNGQCGSSDGSVLWSAPTSNLCNVTGTTPTVTGSGPWSWSCTGTSGGSTATCNTTVLNGQCGSSNGAMVASAPTSNLCSGITPLLVTGTGPWSWSCAGSGSQLWASSADTPSVASSIYIPAAALTIGSGSSVAMAFGGSLNMQTDGNFVLYGSSGALWASNTGGSAYVSPLGTGTFNLTSICATAGNCVATFQGDGNLVLYAGGRDIAHAYWGTITSGNPNAQMIVSANAPYVQIVNPAGTTASCSTVCTGNSGQSCSTVSPNACGMYGTGSYSCTGVCNAVTPPNSACGVAAFSLSPTKTRVRSGGSVTLNWSANNVQSCSLSGPGVSTGVVTSVAKSISPHATVVSNVAGQGKYTLQCLDYNGVTQSSSVTIYLIPSYQEK